MYHGNFICFWFAVKIHEYGFNKKFFIFNKK